MVFTFKSSIPGYEIYMGRDKFENEDLIVNAFPEDVWFHVSELSSAHVYVRMPFGQTNFEELPAQVIAEACQLTKQNSIEGCKQSEVKIVYTPAGNLKKTANMETGQVGFKQQSLVKEVQGVKKEKELLKALEKTRAEPAVDLAANRLERDRRERSERKARLLQQQQQQQQQQRERQARRELQTYQALQQIKPPDEYKGDGSIGSCREIEEDFL
ncbi:hypothetical protein, conserved [Eimeria tenella]|uniref:NFACT RNA-binding domain-containing protein n=1 Tax=Eimeria tenella TaxID=5802 RepID=U6L8I9_EIMTE|nr:hypothetical protein, conserved [Eimeria tenella]CDJ45508.1 hypothetical protein, conserved [Eimeria tenella]|eukprot:XP_013236254.1 hypothetical protein, conserved [Eimeria tenella]